MQEYWSSARQACLMLLEDQADSITLPKEIPNEFKLLRPLVHHGWEMVVIAAELKNTHSQIYKKGIQEFSHQYPRYCKQILAQHGWNPSQLQQALEEVRKKALKHNPEVWLAQHQPFPGVLKRLECLLSEGINYVVLTTKGALFTAELLKRYRLKPYLLYGHEAGSKTEILVELSRKYTLRGFIEDRRATLEKTIAVPQLKSLPCYLANWGYLKPNDHKDLPQEIQLLSLKDLANPLAMWP